MSLEMTAVEVKRCLDHSALCTAEAALGRRSSRHRAPVFAIARVCGAGLALRFGARARGLLRRAVQVEMMGDAVRSSAVAVIVVGVGLAFALTAIEASATNHVRVPKLTCAFDRAERELGCFVEAGECNLSVFGTATSAFVIEGFIEPADANAQRLRPGVWRIRRWPARTVLGYATATNDAATKWVIMNPRLRTIATVRGSQGPAIAMVLLVWGRDCLEFI